MKRMFLKCSTVISQWQRTAHFTAVTLLMILVAVLGNKLTREQIKREQEQRRATSLSGIADYSKSAVITVDADTSRIVGWNNSAERLLGWGAEEVIDADMEFMLPEPYRGSHHERLKSDYLREKMLDRSYVITCDALTKKGETLPVRVRVWGTQHGEKYEFVAALEKLHSGVDVPFPKSRIEKPESPPSLDESPTIGPPTGDLKGL